MTQCTESITPLFAVMSATHSHSIINDYLLQYLLKLVVGALDSVLDNGPFAIVLLLLSGSILGILVINRNLEKIIIGLSQPCFLQDDAHAEATAEGRAEGRVNVRERSNIRSSRHSRSDVYMYGVAIDRAIILFCVAVIAIAVSYLAMGGRSSSQVPYFSEGGFFDWD